ncbi:MAG: hypothetical protein IKT84_00140 [Bacteroidales bacterium]|nr:hypothetical protein [Bacteroidales bacterium]MBR5831020.1 hypothetical protein [Bacteroidales bacterium]
MRKLMLIMAMMIATQTAVLAQKSVVVSEKDVPERFVKDLSKRYPEIKNVEWMKVDSLVYDANFVSNNNPMTMRFSNKGVETSWHVNLEYTPAAIKTYVVENYPKYKVRKLAIVDIRNKKIYKATITKKFLFWTRDTKVLNFEIDGKFIDAVE